MRRAREHHGIGGRGRRSPGRTKGEGANRISAFEAVEQRLTRPAISLCPLLDPHNRPPSCPSASLSAHTVPETGKNADQSERKEQLELRRRRISLDERGSDRGVHKWRGAQVGREEGGSTFDPHHRSNWIGQHASCTCEIGSHAIGSHAQMSITIDEHITTDEHCEIGSHAIGSHAIALDMREIEDLGAHGNEVAAHEYQVEPGVLGSPEAPKPVRAHVEEQLSDKHSTECPLTWHKANREGGRAGGREGGRKTCVEIPMSSTPLAPHPSVLLSFEQGGPHPSVLLSFEQGGPHPSVLLSFEQGGSVRACVYAHREGARDPPVWACR
jgi:hypothetical protein